jgi:imidazolonepropionase-like amidohydrolase
LLDTKTGALTNNAFILIEGDKITAVGPNVAVPAEVEVIDLKDKTVLPGLIDCHTHMTFQPGNYYEDIFRKSPIDVAVVAHIYARRTLEAGFTTVRDVGAGEFIDVALRNAINRGDVVGPRMQVATLTVGATGGHGDTNGFSPYLKFGGFSGLADGVDEIRKLIRFEVKYGADLIKMLATAGVLSEEESVGAPQFSQEEMNAIVEEAKMWGKRVAAHAHGAEGIKRAVRAGVRSIEHGTFLDEEGAAMMLERGTWLVPTLTAGDTTEDLAKDPKLAPEVRAKFEGLGRPEFDAMRLAADAGVKVAMGTDCPVAPHGWNLNELRHMADNGFTPSQALVAATSSAAELLGVQDDLGTLEPPKRADLVVVRGDPLDVATLRDRIDQVWKDGVQVVGPGAA